VGLAFGMFTPGILLLQKKKSKAKEIIQINNSSWYNQTEILKNK